MDALLKISFLKKVAFNICCNMTVAGLYFIYILMRCVSIWLKGDHPI